MSVLLTVTMMKVSIKKKVCQTLEETPHIHTLSSGVARGWKRGLMPPSLLDLYYLAQNSVSDYLAEHVPLFF